MKNRVIKKIINTLFIIGVFVTIYTTFNYVSLEYNKIKVSNEIKNDISFINSTKKDLNYYKDYYKNNDIVGRIRIVGIIDSLLVKSTNNSYYLDHSINKEYDVKGAVFLDYRTNINSKQINIYGHNSNIYDLQFKSLENYLDKSFYEDNKYIELWDGINTFTYEIFSVQIIEDDYEHMNVFSSNKEHIDKLNKSIYKTDIKANIDDDILILQTCIYEPNDALIIINSKKIGD